MDLGLAVVLFASALRFTTPLLLAALGGLYSERAGIVNIALEGIMIFGALAAAVVAQQIQAPIVAASPEAAVGWAAWVGVLAAVVVGALVALLHAFVSIRYRADQVISGTAINLLAIGVPAVVLQVLYDNTTDSRAVPQALPSWGVSPLAFSPLTYLALLLVPVTAFVVYRTPFGLRVRATGESPQAAASVGVSVERTRYVAVVLSGVLAGLAGAFLSIGNLSQFTRNLTAGQGFIALAALIFGKWTPGGVLGASFLFGLSRALAIQVGGSNLLPPAIVEVLPFVLTILVLAGFIGRATAPRALGRPYP